MTTIPVNGWRYEQEAIDLADLILKKHQIALQADFNNHCLLTDKLPAPEQLLEIIETAESTGYSIPVTEAFAKVGGMSCSACAVSTASILQHLPGVLRADVNYANHEALLRYVPGMISMREMQSALQSAGYDLEAISEDMEQQASEQPSVTKQKRKAFGAMILALPLFVVGMFGMHWPFADYIMWVLATPLVFYFGKDFYTRAWKLMKHRQANMDTLVALSTGIAYVFSVFNLIFQDFWHQRGLHVHVYFEASGVIIAFILLGKWLEENARHRTSDAIQQPVSYTHLTLPTKA
jgi:Cu2+-exporting ATPase